MNHEGHEGHEAIPARVEALAREVFGAGLRVHKALGPGLLESAYEHCLAYDLESQGVALRRQAPLGVTYGTTTLDVGYRLDLLVEESLIVEVKSVERLTPLHDAQLLTYLRLSGCRLGLLLNFNVVLFKQGVKRLVL